MSYTYQLDMSSGFFPRYYRHKLGSRGSRPVSPTGNGRRYFCVDCETEYFSAYSLHRHFSVIHRKSSNMEVSLSIPKSTLQTPTVPCESESPNANAKTCPLCSVSLGRGSYARHMVNEHGIEPFLCTVCSCRFSEYKELCSHKQIHNEGKQQKAVVNSSSIDEESNSSPLVQVEKPAKRNPLTCKYCLKECLNLTHMFSHCSTHDSSVLEHGNSGINECHICDRKFTYRSNLGAHLHKHRDLLKCKTCGEQCFFWKELDQHKSECRGDFTVFNSVLSQNSDENINKELSRQFSNLVDIERSSQGEVSSSSGSEAGLS